MWKELGLCAAVCIGSISFAAEKASVRTKDFVLRFAKDKIVLSNPKWQDEVVIRKVMFIRSPHFATPTGAEQLTPDSFKVDYKIDVKANPKDTPEKAEALKKSIEAIKLTALCTATDAGAKIEYTLTSPEYKPDGAMIEFNCWSRFKKGGKGDLLKANGKNCAPSPRKGAETTIWHCRAIPTGPAVGRNTPDSASPAMNTKPRWSSVSRLPKSPARPSAHSSTAR